MATERPELVFKKLENVVDVDETLRAGGKFAKFDEEGNSKSQANVKVDNNGFFLYWTTGSSREVELVDICHIRDTRFGKLSKSIKDRGRETLDNPVIFAVIHGNDLVNLNYLQFETLNKDTAKVWAEMLFKLATDVRTQNYSRNIYLYKAYTKLCLHSQDGKIPLKHFVRMFSDKKRVEMALEQCKLMINKTDGVKLEDFTWENFMSFLNKLCLRPEIDRILMELGSKGKPFLSLDQMTEFINCKQRDSRLNEVLYPPLKREQVRELLKKYENTQLERDQISLLNFEKYLGGEENAVVPPESFEVVEDMSQPLSHYFINSSHNTYLTVGQLTGASSVEMYRQVLLTGCRCIELDCWKGRTNDEEPYITHGFTMTSEILFKDVIEAIAESAFKTSQYPVILSFENHVDSARQQGKMAEYCRSIFGDALLVEPLAKNPLTPGSQLPSPQDLMGKILIKNKRKHQHSSASSNGGSVRRKDGADDDAPMPEGETSQNMAIGGEKLAEKMSKDSEIPKSFDSEEEEDEELLAAELKKHHSDEGTAFSEVNATEEMSSLVNYIEPVKFKSFDWAAKKNRCYEMSSFVETKAMEILRSYPTEFVEYNKRQMSRIYPKGTRVDSSNYMPQLFWNAGCQMVALNFQTLDLPMQLNMGVFEYNGRSGYLLKPEFMRRTDKHFDPFTTNIVDGIVAATVKIKIVSGQFLTEKKASVYVEVDMFGLPTDTKRKCRTRTSNNNSMDPVWEDDAFVFSKVVLPTLASLRVAVFEENGRFIGHRILPVVALRPGYHYLNLKNELNQPLLLASLLVYTEVQDFIPNEHQDYAEALTNPIKHVLDQRERQLAVLMEDSINYWDYDNQCENADCTPVATPMYQPFQSFPSVVAEALVAQAPKEDLIQSVLTVIEPYSIEKLMQTKSYVKFANTQSKELDELHRKHKKKFSSLKKVQNAKIKKLTSKVEKHKKKIGRKSWFSLKKNVSVDSESEERVKSELKDLEQELEDCIRNAPFELIELRKKQHLAKKEMQLVLFEESFKKLKDVAVESHPVQLITLPEICVREKKELQRILEKKRQNSLIEAKKGDKLLEVNEINKKHIQESVYLLRKLEEAQGQRQEKLINDQKGFCDKMEGMKPMYWQKVEDEWKKELDGILKGKYFDSDSQGSPDSASSDQSSNCSSSPCTSPS